MTVSILAPPAALVKARETEPTLVEQRPVELRIVGELPAGGRHQQAAAFPVWLEFLVALLWAVVDGVRDHQVQLMRVIVLVVVVFVAGAQAGLAMAGAR